MGNSVDVLSATSTDILSGQGRGRCSGSGEYDRNNSKKQKG